MKKPKLNSITLWGVILFIENIVLALIILNFCS